LLDIEISIFNLDSGLRVSELIDIRLKDLDLETGRLFVRRVKESLSTHQPIEGDELRAIRAWLREREDYPNSNSNYLFLSERGPITRQAVNYLAAQTGEASEIKIRGQSAYASALDSLLSGEQRLRHALDSRLSRTQKYHARRSLYQNSRFDNL